MSKSKKCFNEIAETINDNELTHKDMEEVIQMLQYGLQHSIDSAIVVLEECKDWRVLWGIGFECFAKRVDKTLKFALHYKTVNMGGYYGKKAI